MKKIELKDIIPYNDYLKIRGEFQQKIIKLKKNRRLQVGENITFVFENRETVLYQIQEMIRLEKMLDEKLIQQEIDVFNKLIPDENELCATIFIEIFERQFIKPILNSLAGIQDNKIFLKFADEAITPVFFDESLPDGRISSVIYAKFKFNQSQVEKFLNLNNIARIEINHPNYKAEALIPENVRLSLMEDLRQK